MHIIFLTQTNQIGYHQTDSIPTQQRGGRGTQRIPLAEGDQVVQTIAANDEDTILIFTAYGRAFGLSVEDLPEISDEQGPEDLASLVSLSEGDQPVAMMATASFAETQQLLFATESGMVKKTSLSEYDAISDRGIIAIKIDEDDALIGAALVGKEQNVFLATSSGMSIHFDPEEVRSTGRNSRGVRGIRLREGDAVVSLITAAQGDIIMTATEHGFGKRTPAEDYRQTSRGGAGIATIKSSERNGKVVALQVAHEDDELLLATQSGRILRAPADAIRVQSRNTGGVSLMKIEADDALVSAIRIQNAG